MNCNNYFINSQKQTLLGGLSKESENYCRLLVDKILNTDASLS